MRKKSYEGGGSMNIWQKSLLNNIILEHTLPYLIVGGICYRKPSSEFEYRLDVSQVEWSMKSE